MNSEGHTAAGEIPAGGYPALEGQSVRIAAQITESAGLPAISLAEAIAISQVVGRYGYPNKYQLRVVAICADIITKAAHAKTEELCAALSQASPKAEGGARG